MLNFTNKQHEKLNFFILFIISLVTKTLIIIFFPGKLGGDTLEYLNIANNIVAGCGISNSNLERSEQVARRGFLIVFESLSSLK